MNHGRISEIDRTMTMSMTMNRTMTMIKNMTMTNRMKMQTNWESQYTESVNTLKMHMKGKYKYTGMQIH